MPPTTPFAVLRARRVLVAASLGAALVLSTLTGASPATASTPSQSAMAYTLLNTINSLRAAHGLPKAVMSPTLIRAASPHSVRMKDHNALSQQFSGEPSPRQRIAAAGWTGPASGENVGAVTSPQLVATWQQNIMKYSSARSIVLNRAFTSVGIGVIWDATRRKVWITEDFAQPAAPVSVQYADAVLSLMNKQRAAHGRPALRMNSLLVRSAHAHNLTMARYNTMSHQLPGEAFFATRILTAGYNYLNAGENIGWNSLQTLSGVLDLQNIMYNEVPPDDGHRQNILNTAFKDVGIDVYFDSHNNKIWLTQDFGSIG